MAARPTKAQVAKRFSDAGIVQPSRKLTGEALQMHLRQRAVVFGDKRTGRLKTRSSQRAFALAN